MPCAWGDKMPEEVGYLRCVLFCVGRGVCCGDNPIGGLVVCPFVAALAFYVQDWYPRRAILCVGIPAHDESRTCTVYGPWAEHVT
jgi:hypothetical protein